MSNVNRASLTAVPRRAEAPSARKLAANRANALRSTGPRTAMGKAVSRRNARRHGLSRLPPPPPARVEALAHALTGAPAAAATGRPAFAAPGAIWLARRAAEAVLTLAAVRAVRHRLLLQLLPALEAAAGGEGDGAARDRLFARYARSERYERAAFARRKAALRALDAALVAGPDPLADAVAAVWGDTPPVARDREDRPLAPVAGPPPQGRAPFMGFLQNEPTAPAGSPRPKAATIGPPRPALRKATLNRGPPRPRIARLPASGRARARGVTRQQ